MAARMNVQEKDHDSSHGSLRLCTDEKGSHPCPGCRETVHAGQTYYYCDNSQCPLHNIHEGCAPTETIWLGLVKCEFTYQQEPPTENNMDCEACGRRVNGWCFSGKLGGRPCYLHPCCARLDFKRENQVAEGRGGRVVFDLQRAISLTCAVCRKKCDSKNIKSWVYVSRCQKYCYHVSCMNQKVVEWTQNEAGTSNTSGDLVKWSAEEALNIVEIAVDVFNFVAFLIFGVGIPVPLKAVRALLLKK